MSTASCFLCGGGSALPALSDRPLWAPLGSKHRSELWQVLCTQCQAVVVSRSTKGSRKSSLLIIPTIILYFTVILMISVLQSSTSTKDTGHLELVLKPLKEYFCTRRLVYSPNPSILPARNSSSNISNTVHHPPTTAIVNSTSVDDLSSHLSHLYPTIHFGRVATVDCHDTDAWTQERMVHDTKLNAVAASSSLGYNGTVPNDCSPVDVARNSFALMESRTQGLRTVEQISNATRLREGTTVRPHEWTSLVTPGSGVSPVWPNITIGPCPRDDLFEGRRRVGEILVRCGVINVSGMSPIKSTGTRCGDTSRARPVDAPVISNVTSELPAGENDGLLITALANWTSEWVHTLVIQPYLQGSFRFQYQGKQSRASASVALRIRRVLSDVYNPVHVAIHALWFIGMLTGNGAHNNVPPPPFLSVPIFRYLHNNGTFVAEDFMFRAFITCAMIGDKTVNDATLSTNTWNRLTRIPQIILNATEKYALSCLRWNVVMTRAQWQDTIFYLRSCIKMGSTFDPFAYDETSPSAIMACYLDELINLGYASESHTSQQGMLAVEVFAPQPIRHFTYWEVFDTAEWCPRDDPVINQKPRTIGIAPGADQNSSTLKIGMTAKDLLDSILRSGNVPNLPHLALPAGTSFCGPFGAIGARLAHTVRITSACQSTSWFPSHG